MLGYVRLIRYRIRYKRPLLSRQVRFRPSRKAQASGVDRQQVSGKQNTIIPIIDDTACGATIAKHMAATGGRENYVCGGRRGRGSSPRSAPLTYATWDSTMRAAPCHPRRLSQPFFCSGKHTSRA